MGEESILFYIDVIKFKNTKASVSEMDDTMKALASELFEKYIQEDGASAVNIPFTITEEIQKHMKHPTADMYDVCVKEIQGLLHRSKWYPFLGSDFCQALCACLAGDVDVGSGASDNTLSLMVELTH
eukprot:TRINITY_DN10842_c0_g1_i1.p1 TRINITY_DN10842_c0_g1~~TRINITY_DN10842_c0_g1_i1.p1  ORF type:complete len:146 (+),score=46.30 TRINITY_DN10842_c0_g1_i1:60-440(+)